MPERVSLFITCLVDGLFPNVGEAVVRVLRYYGVEVDFPADQTCCGQPAFNSGHRDVARDSALHFLKVFEASSAIVCPSGSCAAMVKEFPTLFDGDPDFHARFEALAARTWEFSQFLTDVLGVTEIPGLDKRAVTWHDSCHSLRALGVRDRPRRLLQSIDGLRFRELDGSDSCCGFGGLFSVEFDHISGAMLADKVAAIDASGAECVSATDCSCLMNIAGGLERRGSAVRTAHLAEIVAAALDAAPPRGKDAPA